MSGVSGLAMTSGQGSVCIPNIGPREQRRRRITGIAMLAVTAAAVVWLNAADAPRAWRLGVFIPAALGAFGLFQVRSSTCVVLAAQGRRNMDQGPETIADAAERGAITRQAWRVSAQAVLFAAAVTAVSVWF
jgi:hypothetical protein